MMMTTMTMMMTIDKVTLGSKLYYEEVIHTTYPISNQEVDLECQFYGNIYQLDDIDCFIILYWVFVLNKTPS